MNDDGCVGDGPSFASTSSYTLNSPSPNLASLWPQARGDGNDYDRARRRAWSSSSPPSLVAAAYVGSNSLADATANTATALLRMHDVQDTRWTQRIVHRRMMAAAAPICETDEVSGRHTRTSATAVTAVHDDDAERTRRRKEKQSLGYVLRSGLAGGVAGCVAKTAIAPLDRVKILFQAQNPEYQKYSGKWTGVFIAGREIVRSDGLMALFQGHSATLLRIFPYAAIKYMAYDKLHFYLMPTKDAETSARLFFAGAASGVTSVFITYPLELIRVRLAFETKRKRQKGSLARIVRRIYAEGSTEAPFSGDARKRAGQQRAAAGGAVGQPQANLSTSAVQQAAIANGATAASPVPASPIPSRTALATHKILQQVPILKFYRGFTVTVMGMIPYAGTSFLVFGRCKSMLQHAVGPEARAEGRGYTWWTPSKTQIDLGAGALAGAISQTAAYPFEVVRRRQQIGGIIRPGNILGVSETALWIWRTSGWRGFYVGLSIGFLKVVPMTSISFAVWMAMKRSMGI